MLTELPILPGNWNPVDYVILFTRTVLSNRLRYMDQTPDYTLAKNLAGKLIKKLNNSHEIPRYRRNFSGSVENLIFQNQ